MTRPKAAQVSYWQGFTLVEILVVVAIIAMLAAVGIIQLQRARIVTHEQLALVSVRHISKASQFFAIGNGGTFPANLDVLGPNQSNPPYIDRTLVGNGIQATKHGYRFTYNQESETEFTLIAEPETPNVTGVRCFIVDESQIIRGGEDCADPSNNPAIT